MSWRRKGRAVNRSARIVRPYGIGRQNGRIPLSCPLASRIANRGSLGNKDRVPRSREEKKKIKRGVSVLPDTNGNLATPVLIASTLRLCATATGIGAVKKIVQRSPPALQREQFSLLELDHLLLVFGRESPTRL